MRHQNLLVTIAILWLAAIILAVKMQIQQANTHKNLTKHILFNNQTSCITLVYGPHVNGQANMLDLWLPPGTLGHNTLYPLVVFIHGGAWESGDKSFMYFQNQFNKSGYAVASINYRLTREAIFPAQIEDCKMAIGWLRAHAKIFKIDPDRIGVWGVSAGGHLAALIGTTSDVENSHWQPPSGISSSVQAVCDWCGPTDFTTIAQQSGPNYVLSRAVRQLLGGSPEEMPEMAKEASPVTHVHRGCPPFLIMHGKKDTIVPIEQSKELASSLKSAKSNVVLEIIPSASHNICSKTLVGRVIQFFDLVLKKHG